jgi:hypothetical protein
MKLIYLLKLFLSVIFFLFLLSCSNTNNKIKNLKEMEIIQVSGKQTFKDRIELSKISSDIKYIKLETVNNNSLIGKVDRLLLFKDRIFILDRKITKSIYIFDMNGNLLNIINKIGKGPGEFLKPFDITIDKKNNTLMVYCQDERKINYYNFDGTFLKDWKINIFFWAFQYIKPDMLAIFTHNAYNYLNDYGEIPYNLLIFNTNGQLLSKQFRSKAKIGESISVYSKDQYFSDFDDNIYLYWMFNDTIYRICDNGIAEPFFQIKFQSHRINYSKYSNDSEIFRDIIAGNVWSIYSNVLLNKDFLITKIAAGTITNDLSNIYFLLYNMNSKNVLIFHKAENNTDDYVFNFPQAVFNNYFVSVLYPEQLINDKEKNGNNNTVLLKGIDSKINEFDNPILMFTKFKDFNNELF